MPSDDTVRAAVEILAPATERFRTALASTHEQVEALLSSQRTGTGARTVQAERELGAFAAGHFDFGRIASLVATPDVLPAAVCDRIEHAQATLYDVIAHVKRTPVVTIALGGNLRNAVAVSFGLLGRAFGAALSVQLAKAGRLAQNEHAGLLERFPYARWNRSERLIAPPLVVSVDGSDFHAGSLAEFLDGAQKILVVVRNACPPASLVRLITPGTYVAQVADASALKGFAAASGPAVAAIVPDDAAQFTHDPAGGAEFAARLHIAKVPSAPPTRAIGAISARQQSEELAQLVALGAATASTAAGTVAAWAREFAGSASNGTGTHADPTDLLAGWLLKQAHLDVRA